MKKFILFTTVLVLLILSIGELFRALALRFDPNEPKAVDVLQLQDSEYDIIFMGNSITQQGINPTVIDKQLGSNSYNMAVGGGSILENELMLRNYLISNEKPKLIVYGMFVNEVRWGKKLRPTFRYNFDGSIRKLYRERTSESLIGQDLTANLNRIPLYRYRVALEHALKFVIDPENRNYTYQKGFLQTTVSGNVPKKLPPHSAGINEEAYCSFMQFTKSEGIDTLIVELPNSKSFNDATTGRDAVIEFVRSEIDLGFVSFNDNIEQYSPEMWVGLNHFNLKGANKFSGILADTLKDYYKR